jgi:hypothetical protein
VPLGHDAEGPGRKLLVHVAHLDVRDPLGVEVDVAELRHDLVEEVRPLQLPDLGLELELGDHILGAAVEAEDVPAEVVTDVGRVVQKSKECELRRVVEPVTGDLAPGRRRRSPDGPGARRDA